MELAKTDKTAGVNLAMCDFAGKQLPVDRVKFAREAVVVSHVRSEQSTALLCRIDVGPDSTSEKRLLLRRLLTEAGPL